MMTDLQEENNGEPLVEVPMNNWTDIQNVFKLDWPRGASSCAVLDAQRELSEKGFGYGFKVFYPFGRASSGMVAFNEKDKFYEVIVQCPADDTKELENALKRTTLIDWKKEIIIPFAPTHVIDCVKRVIETRNDIEIAMILPSESFILHKRSHLYKVSLPSDITFGLLLPEHADVVNSFWPHKYPDSVWYFRLLINAKSGYGLFKGHQLISWLFVNEAGALGHMFTIEDERRKGYGEMILKLVCNILLQDGKDVLVFCVKGNVSASNMYKKAGFTQYDCGISWCYLKPIEG